MDRNGKRIRKSTGITDKQRAAQAMAAWEDNERLIESGAKLPTLHEESLEKILKQFEISLIAAGKSQQHVERTGQLIRAVASHNAWSLLGHISEDGINTYSKHLLDAGQAARTIGSVVTALRSFCRWCVRRRHLLIDPTQTIAKPSIESDRRIQRRMVLPDEWKWIRAYLELTSSFKNGQSSKERLLMYRLAIETGLRASEIMSLKNSSLHLSSEPFVKVRANVTKNGKEAQQFISDELAADLKTHVAKKAASAIVFNVVSRNELARTLRSDVEEARAMWLASSKSDDSDFLQSPDSQGEVIDFHALRHTCGAWLVQAGVTLPEVQKIMRHSTIRLTIDCYGHLAKDAKSQRRQVLGGML